MTCHIPWFNIFCFFSKSIIFSQPQQKQGSKKLANFVTYILIFCHNNGISRHKLNSDLCNNSVMPFKKMFCCTWKSLQTNAFVVSIVFYGFWTFCCLTLKNIQEDHDRLIHIENISSWCPSVLSGIDHQDLVKNTQWQTHVLLQSNLDPKTRLKSPLIAPPRPHNNERCHSSSLGQIIPFGIQRCYLHEQIWSTSVSC